jgi:hypothetical protein
MRSHFRIGFAASGEKFGAAIERVEAAMGRGVGATI